MVDRLAAVGVVVVLFVLAIAVLVVSPFAALVRRVRAWRDDRRIARLEAEYNPPHRAARGHGRALVVADEVLQREVSDGVLAEFRRSSEVLDRIWFDSEPDIGILSPADDYPDGVTFHRAG